MTKDADESDAIRTDAENRFLAECLLAFDQAQGKVDMTTVAQAMGYKNVGSAENKWHQIKKKYSIDMRTCRSGEPKTKRLGANEPASPKKATPKRAPRKKAAPVPKEAEPSEEESDKAVEASPSSP